MLARAYSMDYMSREGYMKTIMVPGAQFTFSLSDLRSSAARARRYFWVTWEQALRRVVFRPTSTRGIWQLHGFVKASYLLIDQEHSMFVLTIIHLMAALLVNGATLSFPLAYTRGVYRSLKTVNSSQVCEIYIEFLNRHKISTFIHTVKQLEYICSWLFYYSLMFDVYE